MFGRQGPKELGRRGEDMAVRALKRRGYRIIERNARLKGGELDIIARQGGQLVFIEVKTRSGAAFGSPAEAVGRDKQRRLTRLAAAWLQKRGRSGESARFDVVSISFEQDPRGKVEIIENAFQAQDWI